MESVLQRIGRICDTDKVRHGYLPIYERWLVGRRKLPLTLIEIGVGEGASLRMWTEFLPNARIVAIDNEQVCLKHAGGRVAVEIGDQRDLGFLDAVIDRHGAPDVVIDDGAHSDSATITAFQHLFPRMTPRGLYFVEDLHASYNLAFRDRNVSAAMYFADLVHDVNLRGLGQTGSYEWATRNSDNTNEALTPMQRALESLHFHQSLCIAVRRDAPSSTLETQGG